jgi:hypothetical protein
MVLIEREETMNLAKIDRYIESHFDQNIAELSHLCAQPSVAAQKWGIEACANWWRMP